MALRITMLKNPTVRLERLHTFTGKVATENVYSDR